MCNRNKQLWKGKKPIIQHLFDQNFCAKQALSTRNVYKYSAFTHLWNLSKDDDYVRVDGLLSDLKNIYHSVLFIPYQWKF